jgi:hypothetical protein
VEILLPANEQKLAVYICGRLKEQLLGKDVTGFMEEFEKATTASFGDAVRMTRTDMRNLEGAVRILDPVPRGA